MTSITSKSYKPFSIRVLESHHAEPVPTNDPVFGPGYIAWTGRADAGNKLIQTQGGDVSAIRLQQVANDVQILRGDTLTTTVTNTKVADINLSVGSTRVIPDSLKDPFKAGILTASNTLS